jgi:hypothetical protein
MKEKFYHINHRIMKPKNLRVLPVLGLLLLYGMTSCDKDSNAPSSAPGNNPNTTQISTLPKESLSTFERESLAFMREEEKLARDVYQYLYQKWGAKIFTNIASSEQTHMDAVLLLLQKYNLPDPASGKSAGSFSDPRLQSLYASLTAQGSKSLLDGYIIGATIEDLDLYDLYDALKIVDNQDITLVYNNLAKGSRNHLRSFYKNIQAAGGTYAPQYISEEDFNDIINGAMETGG